MNTPPAARTESPLIARPQLPWIAGCCFLAWLSLCSSLQAGDLPRFEGQVISTAVKYGYQMIAVDLNADGKKDLLAIDEQASEVAWLENPAWTRHVLATNVPRPLNAACWDTDGDGIPEVVLAYRFEPRPAQSVGNVALLIHQAVDLPGERWRKTILDDGGIAAADCVIEDFNGDGKPDLAAIGASTGNVKLYLNSGRVDERR